MAHPSRRRLFCLLFAAATLAAAAAPAANQAAPRVHDFLAPLPPGAIRLGGHLGAQLDLCIEKRLSVQDVEALLVPFRERKDKTEWRSEFWGKWITSAIAAWRYTGDPRLRATLERAVAGLIATQTPDGYMGAYSPENRRQRWDLWGRKYTLLGLLAWHELTGDAAALAAARRQADFLLSEVGPGRASPFENDMWSGMASGSVLEPMVLLHRRTGEARYLEFANYLVEAWSRPDGPDLLRKALAGTAVFAMFPGPQPVVKNYGHVGKSKAYEMMSCYEGLLELHRTTGRADFREAVARVYANIRDTEITLIGSGSDWERWNDGRRRETEPWHKGMETCVSVTWLKFAAHQLRLTGDPACADEIERTTYNALLGAQGSDGTWWCHHAPPAGTKERAPEQCGMHQNCCVASGPRGLMLLPQLAVMTAAAGPVVNLYAPLRATAPLDGGGAVRLDVATDYPAGDVVALTITPDRARHFTLALRIPAWSRKTELLLNGAAQPAPAAGSYARLARRWQPGDQVALRLDLRLRTAQPLNGGAFVAFERGPLVLARDARFGAAEVDQPVALPRALTAASVSDGRPENVWLAYRVPLADGRALALCDFASAGNTWSDASRYRIWLPLAP